MGRVHLMKQEKIVRWIAWKLPQRVLYWAFIRYAAGPWDYPGEVTVAEVMRRREAEKEPNP